jgi:hypothetical protein
MTKDSAGTKGRSRVVATMAALVPAAAASGRSRPAGTQAWSARAGRPWTAPAAC